MPNSKLKNTNTRSAGAIRFCCCLMILMVTACGEGMDISIHDVRINTAPPNAAVTAGYLNIENLSGETASLLQVSCDDYPRIEMHRTVITAGIARMIHQEAVEIPPGTVLEFKPGDYHLMLFRDGGPLPEGETVELSFRFADGSIIEAAAMVTPIQAQQHHH